MPELPKPPPVEDPKTVIFVTPKEPVVITVKELTGSPTIPSVQPSPGTSQGSTTPVTPIVIITPPKYGTVDVQPNGSITYTSNIEDPKSTVIDVIEYRYTNLSGAVVVARREFVITQQGDVPRIIQTGGSTNADGILLLWTSVLILTALVFYGIRRTRRRDA